MDAPHPLDRWIASALTGRQADLAVAQDGARRLHPDYGVFATLDADAPEARRALGALIRTHGDVAVVEPHAPPPIPHTTVKSAALCLQMLAHAPVTPSQPAFDIVPLTEADAPQMYALATLTRPGPWSRLTHRLGGFVGVKRDGRLVAMAGERMKPDAHTEVSGVCTRPDHRGRGYGAALLSCVAHRIQTRGETPFLHVYSDNAPAVALYEALGFSVRRELVMTTLTAD